MNKEYIEHLQKQRAELTHQMHEHWQTIDTLKTLIIEQETKAQIISDMIGEINVQIYELDQKYNQ